MERTLAALRPAVRRGVVYDVPEAPYRAIKAEGKVLELEDEVQRLRGYLLQIRSTRARLKTSLLDEDALELGMKLSTIDLIAKAALEGQCSHCAAYGPTRVVERDEQDIVELCVVCESDPQAMTPIGAYEDR